TCFTSAELTEDQLLLLLESLEEKTVPQQLELVREQTSHSAQNEGERGLLSFSGEKQEELTIAMVEMSGATLQRDGSVACEKDAVSALAALCVSLYVLNTLS
ncbi:GSDA3 protein, partial [Jacana jacana]|nr:GSDA3 protein [Jacana jacana]